MIKETISKLRLKLFDIKIDNSERLSFLRRFFILGSKGIFYSVLLIFGMVSADWLLKLGYGTLTQQPYDSYACRIAESNTVIFGLFGIRQVDYLIEVINVSAGILGVLLGLFYTAFLTIIATKYSNINSTIGALLVEQKTLNKFFILLATLTSFSIGFELILSSGYSPTLFGSLIFVYFVISAVIGFISFGKFTLLYFDTSSLVYDLIERNYIILKRILHHTKNLESLKNGQSQIRGIYNNLHKIKIIVEESKKPEASNTSLDNILRNVIRFSDYYNQIKYLIPSWDGWHIKVNKPKRWEDAKEWDFSLLKSAGIDIIPESVQSYNLIELNLIDTQFDILDQIIQGPAQLRNLFDQDRYVHALSYQCDFEAFSSYFLSLEKLILDKLSTTSDTGFKLQLVQCYSYLLIQYLVGFNANLRTYDIRNLNALIKSLYNRKKNQKPYYIKIWEDKFSRKLHHEKQIEGKIETPLIFAEYELAEMVSYELQNHYKKVIGFVHDKIKSLIEDLKKENFFVGALQLAIGSVELERKLSLFINTTSEAINKLNRTEPKIGVEEFKFSKLDFFKKENLKFEGYIMSCVWEFGYSSYELDEDKLPDLFGNYYHLILEDITSKTFDRKTSVTKLSTFLKKFNIACILYLRKLQVRYQDTENPEYFASKVYPFIVDLFEINSIIIIRGIAFDQQRLVSLIFSFWGKDLLKTVNEVSFWRWILATYNLFKQPVYGLSSSSYSKEFHRKKRLEEFLLTEGIVRKEMVTRGGLFPDEEFVTDIDDFYIQAIAQSMHMDTLSFIDVHEIFVEYYLRTCVSLKELKIEETRYGEQIRRIVERATS